MTALGPYEHTGAYRPADESAIEQELLCSVCGWPFAPADPECGHEIDGESGQIATGIAIVVAGIGLFLYGLLNAGHHPDMRVVAACAIVGVVVLLAGTGFVRYRRHNQADAAATAEVEGRILPNTSTDHFLDGV